MRTSFLPKFNALYAFIGIFCLLESESGLTQDLLDPLRQEKFVNPLTIPSVIDARNGGTFTISITQFLQDLGLRNPTTGAPMLTPVWGYNGSYPGPTIIAHKNVPLNFYWLNNLYDPSTFKPLPHLLPVDTTVEWALTNVANW